MIRCVSICGLVTILALACFAGVRTNTSRIGRGGGIIEPGGDSDVLAYAANIAAAGSTISPTHLAAVNTFVAGCKADNTWSKLKDVGTFTGTNLTAALVKLKSLSGTSYTNVGFADGDYTETTGLKGNGS